MVLLTWLVRLPLEMANRGIQRGVCVCGKVKQLSNKNVNNNFERMSDNGDEWA